MPRISVVVPVYNCERYLGECVDSLLGQTLDDIEVICVDDGSTDSSGEILFRRASLDRRLRLLSEENSGPGSARNLGMAAAKGDVIMFCDADDLLDPRACELISSCFDEEGCDALVYGFDVFPPESLHPSLLGRLTPLRECTLERSDENVRSLLFHDEARPFAARMALSREFCQRESIHWDEDLTLGDDQYFCFEVFPRAQRTTLRKWQLYRYRMSSGSLTHGDSKGPELLLRKMNKHLACERAVLEDWGPAGFMDLCPGDLLHWCIELLLYDASRLPAKDARDFWNDFCANVLAHFNVPQTAGLLDSTSRACLNQIIDVARGKRPWVSEALVALFYVRQRGIAASVRRFAFALRSR